MILATAVHKLYTQEEKGEEDREGVQMAGRMGWVEAEERGPDEPGRRVDWAGSRRERSRWTRAGWARSQGEGRGSEGLGSIYR
ncbi:hypothetical protein PoB_007255900 [Plakobranchus ocellatus]|uniref:Uncharacterized protein n=1 Tax=Plakobranchus ocellatus TaxID=259542 RepID=A0AAV4DPH0_9GAST|nr:hypothetical protein PoB_007255900 [Plakobranchus ocellatus]